MKKILLLGSGELGKEFVISAQRKGQYIIACDSYAGAPAMQVADECEVFSMLDGDALERVVRKHKPDIIVPEIEAIRTERLYDFEKEGIQVVPSARAVNFTMNRKAIRDLAAKELGLKEGTPITYRAGDQPNNALSLNVFNPGEIASTAGTSGVVYGVNGEVNYDPKSRVNTFAHVNHTAEQTRLGVLLCINGTGILNSWVKRNVAPEGISYSDMNRLAAQAPVGSAGVSILPFGNGAERMLENKETGCSICGVNFNLHGKQHIVRAAQEGIVFSFKYGIDIMEQMGIPVQKIHAGHANMFLSPIFRETLAGVTGAVIELYDTDGSVGAAKGAGIGAGVYKDNNEAFATLEKLEVIEPDVAQRTAYDDAYARWKSNLERAMAAF